MSMEEFTRRIRTIVAPKWIRPPATPDDVLSVERRLGIALTDDLRAFYGDIGGTDEATPLENGWITFWSLDSWEPATNKATNATPTLVLIADHSICSWWYAADFRSRHEAPIFIVDGLRPPRRIAGSFAAFVAAALGDDRSIYPEPLDV